MLALARAVFSTKVCETIDGVLFWLERGRRENVLPPGLCRSKYIQTPPRPYLPHLTQNGVFSHRCQLISAQIRQSRPASGLIVGEETRHGRTENKFSLLM